MYDLQMSVLFVETHDSHRLSFPVLKKNKSLRDQLYLLELVISAFGHHNLS